MESVRPGRQCGTGRRRADVKRRVVDNAELLSSAARERIGAALKAHEAKTTNQIAVLTIATLGEDNIGHYATRVFETWKPGKKDKDNGLLLVIVPKERKIRFEVGRGLEGTVPDVVASRTIRNVIAPKFKANQFDQGVEEGLAAIIKQLEGDAGASADAALAVLITAAIVGRARRAGGVPAAAVVVATAFPAAAVIRAAAAVRGTTKSTTSPQRRGGAENCRRENQNRR